MTEQFSYKLQELAKLIKDEIHVIENGGKLSSFKREIKPREKQLKNELKTIIRNIAANGNITSDWIDIRNYFIIMIKDILEQYQIQYPDSKTFEEQKEVILQYFVFFEKYHIIKRIAELIDSPQKYYKSTRKLLYAFQKLVNVSDPEER